ALALARSPSWNLQETLTNAGAGEHGGRPRLKPGNAEHATRAGTDSPYEGINVLMLWRRVGTGHTAAPQIGDVTIVELTPKCDADWGAKLRASEDGVRSGRYRRLRRRRVRGRQPDGRSRGT